MKSLSPLSTPVRVGILGLGRAGWNLHFEPMRKLAGYQIVAVADPLPERAQEAASLTARQIQCPARGGRNPYGNPLSGLPQSPTCQTPLHRRKADGPRHRRGSRTGVPRP